MSHSITRSLWEINSTKGWKGLPMRSAPNLARGSLTQVKAHKGQSRKKSRVAKPPSSLLESETLGFETYNSNLGLMNSRPSSLRPSNSRSSIQIQISVQQITGQILSHRFKWLSTFKYGSDTISTSIQIQIFKFHNNQILLSWSLKISKRITTQIPR